MNIAQEILFLSGILFAVSGVVIMASAALVRVIRRQQHQWAIERELQSMLENAKD